MTKTNRSEIGAAFLEAAIAIPVLLLLLWSALSFGIVYWTKLSFQNYLERATQISVETLTPGASACGSNVQSLIQTGIHDVGDHLFMVDPTGLTVSSTSVGLLGLTNPSDPSSLPIADSTVSSYRFSATGTFNCPMCLPMLFSNKTMSATALVSVRKSVVCTS